MNNNSLIIEIMQGDEKPFPRTIHEGTEKAKTFYNHTAYAHLGGRFPVEMQLSAQNATHMIAAGKYQLSAASYKINQYGSLEIDKYNLELIPLPVQQAKAS